jgi:OFA family oxalate/formate antiporter-like MFS transporter
MSSIKQFSMFRWVYLFLGTLSLLFAGVIYAWSILKAPLAVEFGWDPAKLALNHTLTMVFVAMGNLSAGIFTKRVSSQLILICSAAMISLGFFFTSLMSGENIMALYMSYACLCGIGIGAYFVTTVSVVGEWFPDMKGICSSTLQLGFGFSALILGYLANRLIEIPDFGWRKTYLSLAISIGAVMLLVALLLSSPIPGTPLPLTRNCPKNTAENTEILDISSREMIKRKGFWQYYMFCLLVNGIGTSMISFATDYFFFMGASASLAVLLAGFVAVSNGLGRFLVGVIFDRAGRNMVMLCTSIIAIASPVLLLASLPLNSVLLSATGACLAGASFGCIPSSASPIIRESYGDSHFAANYSIVLTSSMPSSFVATLAGSILNDGGSYASVFLILLLLAILAFIFFISLKRP